MAARREQPDVAAYAIRVSGRLGPLLLSQLPCQTAATGRVRSVVLTCGSRTDLPEIARRLAQHGVEIDWIRQRPEG